MLTAGSRRSSGRVLNIVGPATANARRPLVLRRCNRRRVLYLFFIESENIMTLKSRLGIICPSKLCTICTSPKSTDLGLSLCCWCDSLSSFAFTQRATEKPIGRMLRYGCLKSFKVMETGTNQKRLPIGLPLLLYACLLIFPIYNDLLVENLLLKISENLRKRKSQFRLKPS